MGRGCHGDGEQVWEGKSEGGWVEVFGVGLGSEFQSRVDGVRIQELRAVPTLSREVSGDIFLRGQQGVCVERKGRTLQIRGICRDGAPFLGLEAGRAPLRGSGL